MDRAGRQQRHCASAPTAVTPAKRASRARAGSSKRGRLLVGASLLKDANQLTRSVTTYSVRTGFPLSLRSAGMTRMEKRAGMTMVATPKRYVSLRAIIGLVSRPSGLNLDKRAHHLAGSAPCPYILHSCPAYSAVMLALVASIHVLHHGGRPCLRSDKSFQWRSVQNDLIVVCLSIERGGRNVDTV